LILLAHGDGIHRTVAIWLLMRAGVSGFAYLGGVFVDDCRHVMIGLISFEVVERWIALEGWLYLRDETWKGRPYKLWRRASEARVTAYCEE